MDNDVELKQSEGLIFVKSSTSTKGLALCIYSELTKRDNVIVRGIGAGANNQAVKAVCVATERFSKKGMRLFAELQFSEVPSVDDPEKLISGVEYKLSVIKDEVQL